MMTSSRSKDRKGRRYLRLRVRQVKREIEIHHSNTTATIAVGKPPVNAKIHGQNLRRNKIFT